MELRSGLHVHLIRTIKGNSTVKIHNSENGKQVQKCRNIKDINEIQDAKFLASFFISPPKDDFRAPFSNSARVELESPDIATGEEETAKSEYQVSDLSSDSSDSNQDSELYDPLFDVMTLKRFKKRCNAEKKKLTKSVDLTKQNITSASSGTEKNDFLLLQEDDLDLEQPLSSWRSRCKKRKRVFSRQVSTLGHCCASIKPEENSGNKDLQTDEYFHAPISIKGETPDLDCLYNQHGICEVDDLSFNCDKAVGLNSFTKIADTRPGYVQDIKEVRNGHLELAEPSTFPNVKTIPDYMRVDDPEMNFQKPSFALISESKMPECVVHPPSPDRYTILLHNHVDEDSDARDESRDSNVSCISEAQSCNATENCAQCTRINPGGSSCDSVDDTTHDLASKSETIFANSLSSSCDSYLIVDSSLNQDLGNNDNTLFSSINTSLITDGPLICTNDDSSSTSEKQAQATDNVVRNCHTMTSAYDDGGIESMPEDCQNSELQNPPERLLSTRKAISPTSQEKLCKAMNCIDLHDEIELYECREKLCFETPSENNASSGDLEAQDSSDARAGGHDHVTAIEGAIDLKRVTNKPDLNNFGPKGILRIPPLRRAVPRGSNGCTPQSCSQSAIAFSQRQMHDIESLATKLTKELELMKDILEDTLHSETCRSTSSKYNEDERKTAIKNSSKVEETTKKWLSMMARDCHRFCKIMKLNEKGGTGSGSPTHKQKKKITFADETGGKLCHVRFLEDDLGFIEA